MSQINGIMVQRPCLIWEWTLRCRSRSPSFPLSRSSPSRALSRPRKRQCPPGTWRASGRRKGRRKICTRPGRWSGRSHCDWARGSAWRGDREEAERPTDLRGGRGTGGQREYKKTKGEGEERRDRVSRFGESSVSHQHNTSERQPNKKRWKGDTMREGSASVWSWVPRSWDASEGHALLEMTDMRGGTPQILTDKKAWTMSALTELRGLSLITTKICSSFSRPMKFPNHDFLASLAKDDNASQQQVHSASHLS